VREGFERIKACCVYVCSLGTFLDATDISLKNA